MTLGCSIEAYAEVLAALLPELDVFGGISALIARDAAARWWEDVS